MNEQEVIGYSVYVGIDWADKKHDVCICPRDSDTREFDVIRHCAEAIDAWVKDLHQGLVRIVQRPPADSALSQWGSPDAIRTIDCFRHRQCLALEAFQHQLVYALFESAHCQTGQYRRSMHG